MHLPVHDTDGRRGRAPLQDSTGNVQYHGLVGTSLCLPGFSGPPIVPSSVPTLPILTTHALDPVRASQQPAPMSDYRRTRQFLRSYQEDADVANLYPPSRSGAATASIPTPPIVPTQSLDAHYDAASSLRLRRQNLQLQRRRRHDINPFYNHPLFMSYRKKQADKDLKVWPDVLEDAFLDALLLIPQMGRNKYSMKGKLHGRNMLIMEYLWLRYLASLGPGERPDPTMKRHRKQNSSHIQVLKGFFKFHRCFHFFFFKKETKDDKNQKETPMSGALGDNPVLRALAGGQLPAERPNYEYFSQLLESDSRVSMRPSLCWILISSTAVNMEQDGPLRGEAFKASGGQLDPDKYPHLPLNLKRDEWPERGKIIRGTLLQEYTRSLAQTEASSAKEIGQDWEERFPALSSALSEVVDQNLHDIFHFHVTMHIQEPDQFPEASELNALVEVTVELPALQNHNWKSVTRLSRPWELTRDVDLPTVTIQKKMGNQYMHRPGCENRENKTQCNCSQSARLRRQQLAVPFPADEWAVMLSHLAGYRKHDLDDQHRPRAGGGSGDGEGGGGGGGGTTQVDLLRKVAMFQELWSAPSDSQPWTRRAAVLWTFEPMYKVALDGKTKKPAVFRSHPGTTWRFLTAIDPMSEYHQRQAVLSTQSQQPQQQHHQQEQQQQQQSGGGGGGGPHLGRDAVLSPHPGYQQHMNAAMNENFGSAWDAAAAAAAARPLHLPSLPSYHSHHHNVSLPPYEPSPLGLLEAFSTGTVTPPVTSTASSLHGAYLSAFTDGHPDLHGDLGFLGGATSVVDRDSLADPAGPATDPFLAAAGTDLGVYDDADPAGHAVPWDTHGLPDLDASWPAADAAAHLLGWPETTAAGPADMAHWSVAPATDDWAGGGGGGGGSGSGTHSTATPTSEEQGPALWNASDAAGEPAWAAAAAVGGWGAGGDDDDHAGHNSQLAPLSPLHGGVKRPRADTLEEQGGLSLSDVPKLAIHLRFGEGDGVGGPGRDW